jgi:hypothetical protein
MRTVMIIAILCGVFGQVRDANAYACNNRHYVNSSGHVVHSPSCGRESPRHTATAASPIRNTAVGRAPGMVGYPTGDEKGNDHGAEAAAALAE